MKEHNFAAKFMPNLITCSTVSLLPRGSSKTNFSVAFPSSEEPLGTHYAERPKPVFLGVHPCAEMGADRRSRTLRWVRAHQCQEGTLQ